MTQESPSRPPCLRCHENTPGKLYCAQCGHRKSYTTVNLNDPHVAILPELKRGLLEANHD